MMSALWVEAKIVRIYAEAIKRAFGPVLAKNDPAAELARLLLNLAESTARCAERMVKAQIELEQLGREMGLRPAEPKKPGLRLIDGGRP